MYTSNAFFYEDLDRSETRFAIADAARAIQFTQAVVGTDLLPELRKDLTEAVSAQSGRSGAQLLDEVLDLARASGANPAAFPVA